MVCPRLSVFVTMDRGRIAVRPLHAGPLALSVISVMLPRIVRASFVKSRVVLHGRDEAQSIPTIGVRRGLRAWEWNRSFKSITSCVQLALRLQTYLLLASGVCLVASIRESRQNLVPPIGDMISRYSRIHVIRGPDWAITVSRRFARQKELLSCAMLLGWGESRVTRDKASSKILGWRNPCLCSRVSIRRILRHLPRQFSLTLLMTIDGDVCHESNLRPVNRTVSRGGNHRSMNRG